MFSMNKKSDITKTYIMECKQALNNKVEVQDPALRIVCNPS